MLCITGGCDHEECFVFFYKIPLNSHSKIKTNGPSEGVFFVHFRLKMEKQGGVFIQAIVNMSAV